MSTAASMHAWYSAPVKGNDLLVLLVFADNVVDEDGYLYPPELARVAGRCRLSLDEVDQAIANLVALGELEVGDKLWKVRVAR